MNERGSAGEIHAFVDNCLSGEARAAFEARLAGDEDMRQRVALWQAQNEAIRAAFGAATQGRQLPALARPSNENMRPALPPEVRPLARPDAGARLPVEPLRRSFSFARLAFVLGLAAAVLVLWPVGGPADVRDRLADAGIAAYRAFALASSARLDVATADPAALAAALGPKFRASDLKSRLSAPGWRLLGARVAPGVRGAGALALLDSAAGARIGVFVEPLDAPPSTPTLSAARGGLYAATQTRGGFGFVIVGPDQDAVEAWAGGDEAN